MDIQLELKQNKGAAFLERDNKRLAEMSYSRATEKLIIIDHTEVDESLRGEGIGKKLLLKVIEMARKNDIKIMPLCPFAKSVFDKHEELRDVLR